MTTLSSECASTAEDGSALVKLRREAWRNAYRGMIPGLALGQMLARRGPRW